MPGFEEVYRQQLNAVFRHAVRVVGRRDIAEELTSDAFSALWRTHRPTDPSQLTGWLFTIVRDRATDYWQRVMVEQTSLAALERDPAADGSPAAFREWLDAAPALKPVHRAVLILRYMHGCERADIASRLGLTDTQVKGHLQYAHKLLHKQHGDGTVQTTPPHDAGPDETSWFARWRGSSACPPPALLLPAMEGALPDPEGAAVRAHLAGCAVCRELADALTEARVAPTLDEAARIRARVFAPITRRARRFVYAVAAIVALAAGAWIAWPSANTTRNRPAPSASNTPVGTSSPRAYVLALNKPATELPPESLTVRSGPRNGYARALEDALVPYQSGDYGDAAVALDQVVRAYPGRPHASFYSGTAKLLDGRAAAAVPDLQRARAEAEPGSSLSSEAAWYLAVALERSAQRAAAAQVLKDLCSGSGLRKAQACDGLRGLPAR